MRNTLLLEELSETSNLDAILIPRQNKLDLKSRFINIKSVNPNLKQDKIANDLG